MNKIDTVKSITQSWARKDIDTVLDHVTDDIEFFYAIGQAPIRGKTEMRTFLARLKDHQESLKWQISNAAENENVVMIEGIDAYANPKGVMIQTPHMTTFEFRGDKICSWRDYFDFGHLMALEQGETPNEHVQALIKATS